MRAGQLNRRVQLLRRRPGTDSVGQPSREYDRFAEMWAKVTPQTAREMRGAQQTVNTMDVLVELRWIPGVLPIDRVRFDDGREAGVTSVLDPNLAGAMLELHCLYVAEQIHSGDGA